MTHSLASSRISETSSSPLLPSNKARLQWFALPHKQQEAILDKHRDTNTKYYDWWEDVYVGFRNDMASIGIWVDKMYFSGFWSQGDGACFEGSVDNWSLFLDKQNLSNRAVFDAAVDVSELRNSSFRCKHSGNYSHEYCTSFTYEVETRSTDEYEENDLRRLALNDAIAEYDKADFEEVFTRYFRDQMRDLYKRLEKEHDHLTSDEAVLETLIANDMLEDEINEQTEREENVT